MHGLDRRDDAALRQEARTNSLRFLVCGGVDDGKSTLIEQLLSLGKPPVGNGADEAERHVNHDDFSFARPIGGSAPEREAPGIDVGCRCFASGKRSFIVADVPGRDECIGKVAAGASIADLAVIVVDVHRGSQLPRRQTFICWLFGIRRVVLAVNKMDLVDFRQSAFERLDAEYLSIASQLGISEARCIPISARYGDNVVNPSNRMHWYDGPSLLQFLETVDFQSAHIGQPFRMLVEQVHRSNGQLRGCTGTIASGTLHIGDTVQVLPSGQDAAITQIVADDGGPNIVARGRSITFTFDREIDINQGDVLCAADNPLSIADQFAAHLLWLDSDELLPGRAYLFKRGSTIAQATVTALKHKINVDTSDRIPGRMLHVNEIGVCNISLDKPIAFAPCTDNRELGTFVLLDRSGSRTIGVGIFDFALRRATSIQWQSLGVSRNARAALKSQKPAVIWLTGLSGSGKSTIAAGLEKRLHGMGRHTYILDGDNVRHGLNRDLGFTDADRVENIRRVTEVARLMADAGLIVLVSFISPFRDERDTARQLMGDIDFVEVFVDAPLEVCELRDPKGLYRKARRQEIRNFTGIESPYEPPKNPELRLDTTRLDPEQAVESVLLHLTNQGIIHPSY